MVVEPISKARQQQVIDETERYVALAAELLDRPFDPVPVLFDLKGQAAGMYKVIGQGRKRVKSRVIRYNPWVFAKYWDDNFSTTIPHEVAHYITEQVFGRVQPHGVEWKSVMAAFGADDSRTVDFDMTGIPQRTLRTFEYQCGCRTHQLSVRRHNRVLREGARYLCRYCKGQLQLGALASL